MFWYVILIWMCKSRLGYWKLWCRCDFGSKRFFFKGCGRDSVLVWIEVYRNEIFEKIVNDLDY